MASFGRRCLWSLAALRRAYPRLPAPIPGRRGWSTAVSNRPPTDMATAPEAPPPSPPLPTSSPAPPEAAASPPATDSESAPREGPLLPATPNPTSSGSPATPDGEPQSAKVPPADPSPSAPPAADQPPTTRLPEDPPKPEPLKPKAEPPPARPWSAWRSPTLYGLRRPAPSIDWRELHPRHLYGWLQRYMMWVVSYFVTNAIVTTLVSIFIALLLFQLFRHKFIRHASATSSDVISDTLRTEHVQAQAQALSKDIVDRILTDPKSATLVTQLLVRVLQQQQTKEQAERIILHVFQEEKVKETTGTFFGRLVLLPDVQSRAQLLGQRAMGNVLASDNPRDWLRGLFRRTFASDEMQRSIGEALWRATWFSLTPGVLQPGRSASPPPTPPPLRPSGLVTTTAPVPNAAAPTSPEPGVVPASSPEAAVQRDGASPPAGTTSDAIPGSDGPADPTAPLAMQ